MIHLSNNLPHTEETKNHFVKNQLLKNGIKANVKNGIIIIHSKISKTDLEELRFIYDNYKIEVQKNIPGLWTCK